MLALCLGYVPASRSPAVRQIEAQLLDLRFRWRPPAPPSDDIVLVLIDDASIREVGRWPWSRAVIADGLARLVPSARRPGRAQCGVSLTTWPSITTPMQWLVNSKGSPS